MNLFTCTRWQCHSQRTQYFWPLSVEVALCHSPGSYNFEVASRFLENFWILLLRYVLLRYIVVCCVSLWRCGHTQLTV
jgi:hypothetical protein